MSVVSDFKKLDKSLRGQVFSSSKGIQIIKKGVGRPVTVLLEPEGRDAYNLKFPTYTFTSAVSHFSPKEEERRFCRNKMVLFQIIKDLKKVELWDKIKNKDFLIVNPNNKNMAKKKSTLQETLDSILNPKK
jgi:hypothetical protein